MTAKPESLQDFAQQIERLKLSPGNNTAAGINAIGGGARGRVFAGKVKLRNGKWKSVAIKFFHKKLPDGFAERYARAIRELREAGVPLPKMGMYKHPEHGWLLISQPFVKGGSSKLWNKSWADLERQQDKLEAIRILTKCANAGYWPAEDLVEPFKEKPGVVPIDVDWAACRGQTHVGKRAATLILILNYWNKHHKMEREKLEELFAAAVETANTELKGHLLLRSGHLGKNELITVEYKRGRKHF